MAIQVNLRLPEGLHERVEEARGGEPRNRFIVGVLEAALGEGVASEPRPAVASSGERANGSGLGTDAPSPASPRTSEQPAVTPYESRKGAEKPCRRCKAGIVRFGKCSNCGTQGYA